MNAKPTPRQPSDQSQQPSSPQPATGQQRPAGRLQGERPAQTLAGIRRGRSRTRNSTAQTERPERLASLDAYRGFIMIMLAASGFGIFQLTQLPSDAPVWENLDYQVWQQVSFHFTHSQWQSNFLLPGDSSWWLKVGVSFWDLIQPAFMFMVGVAMPFSYTRRSSEGHSAWRRSAHAAWRALVLVLLGVLLSSNWSASQTNWTFANVLSQIGLGYLFVYALLGRKFWIQLIAFVVILAGYWGFFYSYAPGEDYDYAAVGVDYAPSEAVEDTENTEVTEDTMVFTGRFASWSKNANAGHNFDVWLLNQFPRAKDDEFKYNRGGYVTLNFVPSIATMLLGVFCGQLLLSESRWWQKFLLLVVGGAVCMALGVVASQYACPIVKRIWSPSWVLFSGGWVIWMLAAFYLLVDLCRLRPLAFPLVVVGMNSIAMYMMGQLLRPWTIKTIRTHFLGLFQHIEIWTNTMFLPDDLYGRVIWPTAALIAFWLAALWMYRQKFFVRI